MRKLTRNVLKEIIQEVIREELKEASGTRSTSTIAAKGGRSGETDRAQADYDTLLTREPSSTLTDTSTWKHPYSGVSAGAKGGTQPKFGWQITGGRSTTYGQGSAKDHKAASASLGRGLTLSAPKVTTNPTTTNPEHTKWTKKKSDIATKIKSSKKSDTKRRTQAVGGMKAARGGMKGGRGDKRSARSHAGRAGKRLAKGSGYKPIPKKGKKGKDDEE